MGKSTLFNRLTETRAAIVEETSGVTRDRHYGKVTWNGRDFSVIDTGGYVRGSEDIFEGEIRKQVDLAIQESDFILFVVDVTTGITDLDSNVAQLLRKSGKQVLLVANKVDNHDQEGQTATFYTFGLGEVFPVSAATGSGTGDLLDALLEVMPEAEVEEDLGLPRFAIVGKPNVGKSSLINTLTGQERNIVTPISGTTRDSVDTRYNAFGFDFILVDTAGIRKKAKVDEDIEYYSVLRSVRSIENSDVCILLIDASEGIQKQDLHILFMIESNKKGLVVFVNKWDLLEKDTHSVKNAEEHIRNKIAPFTDVPIIFGSALTKQRIHKVLETALEVHQNRTMRIPTSKLNDLMLEIIEQHPPPSVKGKYIKIKYVTQLPTHSPSFAFFCNLPQYVREDYKRFLENKLRENFNFTGVPLRIFLRKK